MSAVGLRRTLVGVVMSDKMKKTVVVQVSRRVQHPVYGKYMVRQKKYMAHDPENSCHVGDMVLIEECRAMSRHKRWRIKNILERAV